MQFWLLLQVKNNYSDTLNIIFYLQAFGKHFLSMLVRQLLHFYTLYTTSKSSEIMSPSISIKLNVIYLSPNHNNS